MFCPHCGAENSDSATFCSKCGKTFGTEIEKSTKSSNGSKSMFLAMLLSFFLTGIGIAYAGNVKKGLIYFGIGIILSILNMYVSSIFGIFVFVFWIFALYVTYKEVKGEEAPSILDNYL